MKSLVPFSDLGTSALLVGLILVDGMRRLRSGDLVLRLVDGVRWKVVAGPAERPSWRLISPATPFTIEVILARSATTDARRVEDHSENRGPLARVPPPASFTIQGLRAGCVAVTVVFVLGVPAAASVYGLRGLLVALMLVFFGTCAVASIIAILLIRQGVPWLSAIRIGSRTLSPFAVARAPQVLLEPSLPATYSLETLTELVDWDDLCVALRPTAYDWLKGVRRDLELELSNPDYLRSIISTIPTNCGHDERFCPRCGAVYRPEFDACEPCDGVELRSAVSRKLG